MDVVQTLEQEPDLEARGSTRPWWLLVLAGGLLGIVGTIWQTVERLAFESGSAGVSFCEINAAVSCSGVYSHWQSAALGVPNSLIGLPVFAVLVSAAVAALLGSRHSGRYLVAVWGLALFMTAFATWYMQQTAFTIGSLCVFCAASLVNIMIVGVGLTRVVEQEGALGDGRVGSRLTAMVGSQVDLALWLGLGMLVTAMLVVGLAW